MTLNPSEIILTIVNFLLLLLVLNRFLFKPYLAFMDARESEINAAEVSAAAAKERVKAAEEALKAERAAAISEREAEGARVRSALLDVERAKMKKYSAELEAARSRSEEELNSEELALRASMEKKVPELSERLLAGLLKGSV